MMGPLLVKWVDDRPERALAWLGGNFLVALAVLVVGVLASWTEFIVIGGFCCIVLLIQGSIYGPRARRAMKRARG
jgi:hypothetical protein